MSNSVGATERANRRTSPTGRRLAVPRLLIALLSAAAVLGAVASPVLSFDNRLVGTVDGASSAAAAVADVRVSIDLSSPEAVSNLSTGVTHTHYSLDPWNNAQAVANGKQLLQASTRYQNQHIMGWGAETPEPSPGVYNWSSLDLRVQLMRDTGATPIITLCCAPGWMRPTGYQDNWTYLGIAPDPSRVRDFADLARVVAQRYPDVKYFQVWNELKGMWGSSPGCTPAVCGQNRWDYERYTTLYNAVYDAVRAVRPDAQLGGPYVVVDNWSSSSQSNPSSVAGPYGVLDQRPLDVIKYWLVNKRGAQFITIDGGPAPRDGKWVTDEFTAGQYFVDVYNWIRSLDNGQYPGARTLPVVWGEWYPNTPQNWQNLSHFNAVMASDLAYTVRSGANLPLIWEPQGDAQGFAFPMGIWTDSRIAGGGQATPFFATQKAFGDYFPPGTPIYRLTSSDPSKVTGIASASKTILISKTPDTRIVSVNENIATTLGAYEVKVVNTPPVGGLVTGTVTPPPSATATPTRPPSAANTPMPPPPTATFTPTPPPPTATATPASPPPSATPVPTYSPSPPAPTATAPRFGVDTTPPTVAFSSPVNGAIVSPGQKIPVVATVSDDVGIARVEFLLNGRLLCGDTTAPYQCLWNVSGRPGTLQVLQVAAYDLAGNRALRTVWVIVRWW